MEALNNELFTLFVMALVFFFILKQGPRKKLLCISILLGTIGCAGQLIEGRDWWLCVIEGTTSMLVWYSILAGVSLLFFSKKHAV